MKTPRSIDNLLNGALSTQSSNHLLERWLPQGQGIVAHNGLSKQCIRYLAGRGHHIRGNFESSFAS